MFERLLRNPITVVFGTIFIAFVGTATLRDLPVDLFPRLDYPLINIVTHYPAGTAEDMEQLVTRPVENAMLGLTDLQRVRSISAPGFSQVTVEFTWDVNVLQARQLVESRLAQAHLPTGAEAELENIGTSLAKLSTYTISGGDPVTLRSWTQYRLKPTLAALPGVARVDVMGGGEASWRIDIDPIALRNHRLTMEAIAEAVRSTNVLDTGGYLESHGRELLIRTDGRLLTIDDLKHVTVAHAADGRPLLLGDVAHVYNGVKPQRYVITSNRQPAVAFTIQKQPGASTVAVSSAVTEALARTPLPSAARLTKFYDQADIIGLAYRNMRNNLLTGALLAIVAVAFVLGWNRTSLVIAASFPLVVLATFAAMGVFSLGLNLMTLGAITVAIGLITDDAIVVLENIDRHKTLEKSTFVAVLNGSREVLSADVAGSLTVLAAFVPLVVVSGLAGRLFQPFGLTFGFILLFSLLFSLTLIPLASVHWAPRKEPQLRDVVTWAGRGINRLGGWNMRLLNILLLHRVKTLIAVVLILFGSLALLAFNPARMLPLLDENSLLVSYQLAPGTSLAESNRLADELERRLLELPGVESVYRRTGSPELSVYTEKPADGELVVRLNQTGTKYPLVVKMKIERLLATVPGMNSRVNEPTSEKLDESFSGLPALFGITIFGNNLKELYNAALRVERAARKVAGLTNVVNNTKIPADQIRVGIDRTALARFDVSAATVAQAVHTAMQGDTLAQVVVEQQPIGIFLRYGASHRANLDDLMRVEVPNRRGELVPLGQVAHIQPMSSYPTIEHQHGVRALTLTAEINGNPLAVIHRLDQTLASLRLPKDTQIRYSGEYGQLLRTGEQMLWVLLASALLVYGIIAVQLGNLLDPIVILTKLPLDFMGAAVALFVTRQPLDLTVAVGFITLVGVSTNHGIMLLTFTRNFRRQGMSAPDAVREAVRVRTRPMMLTHLTALLALIPAAVGLGAGPQLLKPLGIMLFGGLTAGTLLTLNVLPIIYVMTDRWRASSFK